jgi:hypothetical protein
VDTCMQPTPAGGFHRAGLETQSGMAVRRLGREPAFTDVVVTPGHSLSGKRSIMDRNELTRRRVDRRTMFKGGAAAAVVGAVAAMPVVRSNGKVAADPIEDIAEQIAN